MRNVSQNAKEFRRSILLGILVGVGLALVFAGGFFFRDLVGGIRPALANPASEASNGYPLLEEVQTLIDQHYLRQQPSATEREYGAIRGMLATLQDKYTFFIDPPVAQSESQVLAGTYGGIGVLIQRNEQGEIVLLPFPDAPAAQAGIEPGDILTAVNDTPLDSTIGQDQIDQMLRGEVKDNNGVRITVRKPDGSAFSATIPFAVIDIPSVVWRVLSENNQLGYVQVLRFTNRTPEELRNALADLNGKSIKALVLDLRNNAGGLLQESIQVADEFIDQGPIAFEDDNAGEKTFDSTPGGGETTLPMVVLVNQGTASGAELVAGALQDSQRGFLIGQKTYGKGTVQQIFPLSDGSSLHVTSAEWFTPAHHQLTDNGLEPNTSMIPDANGRDVELGEAVRHLQAALTAVSH